MDNHQETSWLRRQSALRDFATSFIHLYHSLLVQLQKIYSLTTGLCERIYRKILAAVGPKHGGKPSSHIVVWTLFTFVTFLVFISLAVQFPRYQVMVAFVSISSIVTCTLSVFVWRDLRGSKMTCGVPRKVSQWLTISDHGEYRRNLGNSILTVLFTVILLTVVYPLVWYHGLNAVILQLREDILVCITYFFLGKNLTIIARNNRVFQL